MIIALVLGAWLAAWLATQAAGPPRCTVGAEDDLGCARGFEARERNGARPFRWTDDQATVVLAGSGYGGVSAIELSLAAPRPPGAAAAYVSLTAGRQSVGFTASAAPRRYRLLLPPGFPTGDHVTLTVTSSTFTPENGTRSLGAMVYEARAFPLGEKPAPALLPTLALLALGLAASLRPPTTDHRPPTTESNDKVTRRQGDKVTEADESVTPSPLHPFTPSGESVVSRRSSVVAVGVIAGVAALWASWPGRVVPFLPVLALIVGGAVLVACRTGGFALLRRWPILAAILGSALIDGAILGGLRGPAITLVLAAQAALTVWAIWHVSRPDKAIDQDITLTRSPVHPLTRSPAPLLMVALAVRLLAFAARLLTGRGANDPDVELFYSYGRATLELGVPLVEYPSGALVPWALLALPASRELFALLLPLLNLACDLAIVWAIWALSSGKKGEFEGGAPQKIAYPHCKGDKNLVLEIKNAPVSNLQSLISNLHIFALFYALSPLLLPFWHGKYDPLPAALLAVGLAAFALRRPGWAGVAIGLGGAIKWVPWLAAPFLAWHLLRAAGGRPSPPAPSPRRGRGGKLLPFPTGGERGRGMGAYLKGIVLNPQFWRFTGGLILAVALVSLPFALQDPQTFVQPYLLQGGRQIAGESIWLPLALPLKPALLEQLGQPWKSIEGAPISPGIAAGAQALVLLALALAQVARPPTLGRTVALAALAPAIFLLLNRVFSPQYLLPITACMLCAGALALRGRRALTLVGLLALMQAANLLVWPNTASYWLLASIVMFTIGMGVAVWLVLAAGGWNAESVQFEKKGEFEGVAPLQ